MALTLSHGMTMTSSFCSKSTPFAAVHTQYIYFCCLYTHNIQLLLLLPYIHLTILGMVGGGTAEIGGRGKSKVQKKTF